MTTITDFLLARIAEDEEAARAAGNSPFKPIPRWMAGESNGAGIRRDDGVPVAGHSWPHEMDHIARFDPTRVLVECEAKRSIVAFAQLQQDVLQVRPDYFQQGVTAATSEVLRALAQVYADHPSFDPAWKA